MGVYVVCIDFKLFKVLSEEGSTDARQAIRTFVVGKNNMGFIFISASSMSVLHV